MTWMNKEVLQWTCDNTAWAEPDANMLLRKLVTMNVKEQALMDTGGSPQLMQAAVELDQRQEGAGKTFLKEQTRDRRLHLADVETKEAGPRFQKTLVRKDQLLQQFKDQNRADKEKYMNSCGVCAGYALLWLSNAMHGYPLRKPEQSLAAEMQSHLVTRWLLKEDAAQHTLSSDANQRAAVYRKALKSMTLWAATVKESASGMWDWQPSGLPSQTAYKTSVLVDGAGAREVWSRLSACLGSSGGAILAFSLTGSGGVTVGHAIAFYQKMSGATVHVFDANVGLGLYPSPSDLPAALEAMQVAYKIKGSTHGWTLYEVGVNQAVRNWDFTPRDLG